VWENVTQHFDFLMMLSEREFHLKIEQLHNVHGMAWLGAKVKDV
jgi:hypothetical protein